MTYSIQLLADENILLGEWMVDFVYNQHIHTFEDEVRTIFDTTPTKLTFIMQMHGVKLTFDDILTGASNVTRKEKAIFLHENIEQVIFVTESKALQMAARGLKTATFGNVDVKVFEALNKALAFVRSKAA